jgi:hypothetical protein
MFGILSTTILPGAIIGLILSCIAIFTLDVLKSDFDQKSLPDSRSGAILFPVSVLSYWVLVGNTKEKAWKNLTKFCDVPIPVVSYSPARSVISKS